MPVQWTKAKSAVGAGFDGISIIRQYPPNYPAEIIVSLSFYLESVPKKFRLSDKLQKVLGI